MTDNEKELNLLDLIIREAFDFQLNHRCEDIDPNWFHQFDFKEEHLIRLGEEFEQWNSKGEYEAIRFDRIGVTSAGMFLYYKLRNGKYS